jgi:zinc/manganese transport system permease protein
MWCATAITTPGFLPMADPASLLVVLGQPFMQRALLGGLLTGGLGGLLGSFAVLRQLSFFSDALGHSALLGISLGILLGVNPTLVLIPFAVLFALLVNQLVARSGLPADALLNIVYSTSLAFAVVALSLVETYRGGIQQLLFGDILGISWHDLAVIALLLVIATAYLALSLRAQVLLTLNSDLAGAFGMGASRHRLAFIVLLAVVVAVSIKAVGVLLNSAFVVIPACGGRSIAVAEARPVKTGELALITDGLRQGLPFAAAGDGAQRRQQQPERCRSGPETLQHDSQPRSGQIQLQRFHASPEGRRHANPRPRDPACWPTLLKTILSLPGS